MRFIHLDSIDDERVAAYVNLTEIQLRNRLEPSKGLFIAESPKVIDRALAAGREPISLLVEESWIDGMSGMFDVIEKRWGDDIPVYVASPEQLKRLTGYRLHRGALAAMKRWSLPSVEEVCRGARRVAVMENIVDHTNVGALDAFGCGARRGCGARHSVLWRPVVPARGTRVHGHGVPSAVDAHRRGRTSIIGRSPACGNCMIWGSPP